MRRAVLTLVGTAAGLAALLSFKTHSGTPAANAASASATTAAGGADTAGNATPAASATRSAKSTSSRTGKGASSGRGASSARSPQALHTSAAAATSAPAVQRRTVTGTVANTQRGPMQVQITLSGTKITKVTVLQQTDDGPESNQIDSYAIPKLESETLAAQSASIDAVSGASYTSSGYIQSLQSAIDQAGA
jgi:uncharacterized protein with FMN-binding domain